ncbi:MAG: hypothetical protein Q9160_004108 [Pyrenula sp. 1 TL-2023]
MATEGDCPICFNPLSDSQEGAYHNDPSTSANAQGTTSTASTDPDTTTTTTTSCSHTFHTTCLSHWTDSSDRPRRHRPPTCPLCRRPLPPSIPSPWIRVSRPDGWRAWVEITPHGVCQHARARTPKPEGRLVEFTILRHFNFPVPLGDEDDDSGDGGILDARLRVDMDAATEAMRQVLDLIAELPRFDVKPVYEIGGVARMAFPLRPYWTNSVGFHVNWLKLKVFPPISGPISRWERAERFGMGGEVGSLLLQKGADLRKKRVKERLMEEVLEGRVHPFRCEWKDREGRQERRGETEALENRRDLRR